MKNVNLSHQLEMLKLKNSHEIEAKQVQADRELQNKLTQIEKQLAAKENDFKMKMMAKEQEFLGKENDFKLQMKDLELKLNDLENANNLKLLELTKEKDATIQTLRNEIEMLKTKVRPHENVETQPIKANELQKQEEVEPKKTFPVQIERVFTKAEILAWGPDTFFGGKVLEEKVFESYEDWYRRISLLLVNDNHACANGTVANAIDNHKRSGCTVLRVSIAANLLSKLEFSQRNFV